MKLFPTQKLGSLRWARTLKEICGKNHFDHSRECEWANKLAKQNYNGPPSDTIPCAANFTASLPLPSSSGYQVPALADQGSQTSSSPDTSRYPLGFATYVIILVIVGVIVGAIFLMPAYWEIQKWMQRRREARGIGNGANDPIELVEQTESRAWCDWSETTLAGGSGNTSYAASTVYECVPEYTGEILNEPVWSTVPRH